MPAGFFPGARNLSGRLRELFGDARNLPEAPRNFQRDSEFSQGSREPYGIPPSFRRPGNFSETCFNLSGGSGNFPKASAIFPTLAQLLGGRRNASGRGRRNFWRGAQLNRRPQIFWEAFANSRRLREIFGPSDRFSGSRRVPEGAERLLGGVNGGKRGEKRGVATGWLTPPRFLAAAAGSSDHGQGEDGGPGAVAGMAVASKLEMVRFRGFQPVRLERLATWRLRNQGPVLLDRRISRGRP